jgi:hypothetical protein
MWLSDFGIHQAYRHRQQAQYMGSGQMRAIRVENGEGAIGTSS